MEFLSKDPLVEWASHSKNIMLISNAGKPIWCRWGTEEASTRMSSIIQAIVSRSIEDLHDPISSIVSGSTAAVFLTFGPIHAVGFVQSGETESAIHQLLRRIHDYLIFVSTDQIHNRLRNRPNIDIRNSLLGCDAAMRTIIRLFNRSPSIWLDCYPMLGLPSSQRTRAQHILQSISSDISEGEAVVYTILSVGYSIIAWSTNKHTSAHLSPSDVVLLTTLLNCSAPLRIADAWTPLCLSSLSSSAFAFGYMACITPDISLFNENSSHENRFLSSVNKFVSGILPSGSLTSDHLPEPSMKSTGSPSPSVIGKRRSSLQSTIVEIKDPKDLLSSSLNISSPGPISSSAKHCFHVQSPLVLSMAQDNSREAFSPSIKSNALNTSTLGHDSAVKESAAIEGSHSTIPSEAAQSTESTVFELTSPSKGSLNRVDRGTESTPKTPQNLPSFRMTVRASLSSPISISSTTSGVRESPASHFANSTHQGSNNVRDFTVDSVQTPFSPSSPQLYHPDGSNTTPVFLSIISTGSSHSHLEDLSVKRNSVAKNFEESGVLHSIAKSVFAHVGSGERGLTNYALSGVSAASYGILGLVHFLYINKSTRQFTMSMWPSVMRSLGGHTQRKSLLKAYQHLYHRVNLPVPQLRHAVSSFKGGFLSSLKTAMNRENPSSSDWMGISQVAAINTTNFIVIAAFTGDIPSESVPVNMESLAKLLKKENDKFFMTQSSFF